MDYSTYNKSRYLPELPEAIEQGNRTLRAISKFFDKKDTSQKILEIGCASGSFLKVMQGLGFASIRGVDTDAQLAKYGSEEFGLSIINSDWLSYLSSSRQSYDLIIALDVIEHLSSEDIERILGKTFESLSPRGRLILRMPNPSCPFVLPTYCGDLTHKLLITSELLEHLLRKSGFSGKIIFQETRPDHSLKKWIYFLLHYSIVRPILGLFHFHFYGAKLGPVTRNIYCCAMRDK